MGMILAWVGMLLTGTLTLLTLFVFATEGFDGKEDGPLSYLAGNLMGCVFAICLMTIIGGNQDVISEPGNEAAVDSISTSQGTQWVWPDSIGRDP